MLRETQAQSFIVLYDSGVIAMKSGREISHMYDLSDCDYMDGVKAVYAVSEDCELVPVTLGEVRRDDDPGNNSIVWGYSAIKAGTKLVGHVHWTSH
jgi:hypothetical protein